MGIALLASKTFWFNVLAFAVIVAKGFGLVDFQHDPAVDQYANVAIILVNILLRLLTKEPIVALVKTK